MNVIKIGITGSFGKTSCKNILYAMLSEKYLVTATEKNFNTPMGLALTIRKMTGKEEILIAEMGARRKGDVTKLCEIVRPDYSITTGVCGQHLETFRSLHTVFMEKFQLAKHTEICSFFNGGDVYAEKMYDEFNGKKALVNGKNAFLHADNIQMTPQGSEFDVCVSEKDDTTRFHVKTRLLGRHNIDNVCLCAALSLRLGVSAEEIARAVEKIEPIPHRLEYSFQNGIHILDDGYNSNVIGVRCALETMEYFGTRKVVVAQGIAEGGRERKKINRSVGKAIAEHADVIIVCGPNQKDIERGIPQGFTGEVYRYKTLAEAQRYFKDVLRPGDVLLLQNDIPDYY